MTNQTQLTEEIRLLEENLDRFDLQLRTESLIKLTELADSGILELPEERAIANLHCHTFYSYNGYGYSPSHIAWLGRKLGAQFMGIIDFDVLDGVDEFLNACSLVGIRGTAGIETRVFIPEFSQVEINSPGEPGVAYHMGTGFSSSTVPDSVAPALEDIRQRARGRNLQIMDKINAFLSPLTFDYETEIVPLTPAGNVTERHMVQKIAQKANAVLQNPAVFWSDKLKMEVDEIAKTMENANAFQNLLRSKLMKRGGVAYVQPDQSTFPALDEFHAIVEAAGALPCTAWLDGTTGGEQNMEALLDLQMAKGVAALNIIPDRNWNIAKPEVKERKIRELFRIVELAQSLDLPILVGTEMNAYGQKLMDDFDTPELAPLNNVFIKGANFLYGHTIMARHAGMGYQSKWAKAHFNDRKSANQFYQTVGSLADPKIKPALLSIAINPGLSPELIIKALSQQG
jgi:hypothetical protein